MEILKLVLNVAIVVNIGLIILLILRALSKRKYWSYWEKFTTSKEFMPTPPIFEYTPENKQQAKKILKKIGYAILMLIVLVFIQFLIK